MHHFLTRAFGRKAGMNFLLLQQSTISVLSEGS